MVPLVYPNIVDCEDLDTIRKKYYYLVLVVELVLVGDALLVVALLVAA